MGKEDDQDSESIDLNTSKELFAVKVIRYQSKEVQQIAKREYDTLQGLNHSSIIKNVDYFDDEMKETVYYVLEYFEDSTSVHDYVQKNERPSIKNALKIMQQVLEGLEHMHEKLVVHRDINPYNVLVF